MRYDIVLIIRLCGVGYDVIECNELDMIWY